MKCDPEASLVIAALEAAVASGRLAPAAEATARRLVARLSSPVRVAILGLPGSGKSHLLNMLAGQPVIPHGTRLPSIMLTHGDAPRTHIHLPDGRVETRDGLDLKALDGTPASRIELEAPLRVLERIALSEIAIGTSVGSQRAAIDGAAKSADMLLWCTQDFGGAEPTLWSQVPDPLKDHAFLVLTKADQLHRAGVLAQRMADLEDVVADEFHSLFPVAAQQGLAALSASPPNPGGFAASGGRALAAAIHRHVELGRRADRDNARLFLSRHGFAEQVPAAAALPAPAPGPAAAAPPSGPAKAAAPGRPPAPAPLRERLLARLQEGAAELDDLTGTPPAGTIAEILSVCSDTADSLAAMFSGAQMQDPELAELYQDIEEVAEMVLLMQIEANATAAADAVTLMLQLRRSLEA
jgi:energy-coupling factor transporter ATP-binding protein EcfA2